MDQKESANIGKTSNVGTGKSSSRPWIIGAAAVATAVVLGLALGLGLGLGLRHNADSAASVTSASATPSSTSSSPSATSSSSPRPTNGTGKEDWRRDTDTEYILDTSWDLNATPTTRTYNFVITEGTGWPDGVVRDMLFINGKFPGPVIELNRGDRLIINVTNALSSNATTMHWHGLYQNGTNWYDGTTGVTQCGIPVGQSFLYNFTVENQFGTFWYHSHYSTQYLDGIVGPLIVHAPEEAEARKLYDEERIVMIQDWYHDFSTENLADYLSSGNENTEPIPDNGLINGANYFNCSSYSPDDGYTCYDNSTYTVLSLTQNKRTRIRLINSGAFTEFQFSIDNHTLSVIEADSTLTNSTTVHRVPIHVAQRYSVVVNANQSISTNYWMRGAMITACFTGDNDVLDTTTRAIVTYSSNSTTIPDDSASVDWADAQLEQCQDLDAGTLVPSTVKPPPPATKFYRIDFAFQIGDYQLDRAQFNGTSWRPLSNTTTLQEGISGLQTGNASSWDVDGTVGIFGDNQFVVGASSDQIEVIDVLLYSLDEGSHPFHLHGYQFWILESGSGPFDWSNYYSNIMPSGPSVTNALRRDTLTVQSYTWSLIRFVADNPGLWALHCHIAWHMEAGLLMQFMTRASVMKTMTVPNDVKALCTA